MKIKICGLLREEEISYVNEAQPDYIGFVFAKSKRCITQKKAEKLKNILSPQIQAVGVFVNEEKKYICQLAYEGIIDLIQLHGEETIHYVDQLKEELLKKGLNTKIIQAVSIKSKEPLIKGFLKENSYPGDYLLFDTYTKDAYGGSGKCFDWDILKEVTIKQPFFLAGGISIGNIKEAIKKCSPFCVDISSGVETNGRKDLKKIKEIVKTAKGG